MQGTPYFAIAGENRLLFMIGTGMLLALLLLAIVVELLRRRTQRRQQAAADWDKAEKVAKEKGASDEEWGLLRDVMLRWCPREPLSAMGDNHHFDACVEAELNQLEAGGQIGEYEATGTVLRKLRTRLGLDFVPFGQPIHSTRELTPRHPLWIADTAGEFPDWYHTRVVEVTEAHFTATQWPGAGEPPELGPGQEIRCHMWRDDDARYSFRAKLMQVEGDPPTWSFRHTVSLKRIQSREYYRSHVDQATTVSVLRLHLRDDEGSLRSRPVRERLDGRINSLSAGGLAAIVAKDVPVNSVIRVALKLPSRAPFDVHVSVVDCELLAHGRYRVRGRFLDVGEETADTIAHYVMQRQQLLLAAENRSAAT